MLTKNHVDSKKLRILNCVLRVINSTSSEILKIFVIQFKDIPTLDKMSFSDIYEQCI